MKIAGRSVPAFVHTGSTSAHKRLLNYPTARTSAAGIGIVRTLTTDNSAVITTEPGITRLSILGILEMTDFILIVIERRELDIGTITAGITMITGTITTDTTDKAVICV